MSSRLLLVHLKSILLAVRSLNYYYHCLSLTLKRVKSPTYLPTIGTIFYVLGTALDKPRTYR